jgi:hypothetical protein
VSVASASLHPVRAASKWYVAKARPWGGGSMGDGAGGTFDPLQLAVAASASANQRAGLMVLTG